MSNLLAFGKINDVLEMVQVMVLTNPAPVFVLEPRAYRGTNGELRIGCLVKKKKEQS